MISSPGIGTIVYDGKFYSVRLLFDGNLCCVKWSEERRKCLMIDVLKEQFPNVKLYDNEVFEFECWKRRVCDVKGFV